MPDQAEQQATEWKPPTKDEWERREKELKETRQEAGKYRIEAKSLEEEAKAARSRAAELEPYEGTIKEEVETLKRDLGDKSAVVEGLSPAQALRVLRTIKVAAAGPGAVNNTTAGQPKAQAGEPDLSRMTPDELKKYMKELPIKELRKLTERFGVTPRRSPFG